MSRTATLRLAPPAEQVAARALLVDFSARAGLSVDIVEMAEAALIEMLSVASSDTAVAMSCSVEDDGLSMVIELEGGVGRADAVSRRLIEAPFDEVSLTIGAGRALASGRILRNPPVPE